jgi:hypothetical protein
MGCTVRALGADGLRAFEVYLISEVFGKVFREKISFGRTVYGSKADGPKLISKHTEWCAARADRANGPQPAREQSARPWRTVCGVPADSPPGPTGISDSS